MAGLSSLLLMAEIEIFDRKLSIHESHDDVAVLGVDRSVDDSDVAVAYSRLYHRVAIYPSVESGFRMSDKVTVEIYALMSIVVSRRRESRLYLWCKLQVLCFFENTFYDFYITLFHSG